MKKQPPRIAWARHVVALHDRGPHLTSTTMAAIQLFTEIKTNQKLLRGIFE
jgi:hypothetical protein